MSNHRIVLVGGGRFGREIAAWIGHLQLPFGEIAFIDDEKQAPDIIGPIRGHQPLSDAAYLTCLGDGSARRRLRLALQAQGARFANFIDPAARVASPLEGTSNNILLGCLGISSNVVFGNDLLIHGFASIGHDVTLGDGVTVGAHAFIGGGASLGERCTVHPNASVLPNVRIGEGAVVGAGSVAIKDVAPYTTVFGLPAKVIAYGKPSE